MAANGGEGRPRHPIRHGVLVGLICALAFGAGLVKAMDQANATALMNPGSDSPAKNGRVPSCDPADGATVTETLTIHSRTQPISYNLAETAVVPTSNPYAHTLTSAPNSGLAEHAAECLFPLSLGSPTLVSVADHVATFTAASRPLYPGKPLPREFPPDHEWHAVLDSHSVRFTLYPQVVCPIAVNGFAGATNWANSDLTLTVDSEASPVALTPPPDTLRGHSYSWTRSIAVCPALPRIGLTVPVSLAGYLSTVIATSAPPESMAGQLIGWSVPVIDTLIAVGLCLILLRDQHLVLRLMALAALGVGLAAVDLGFSLITTPHRVTLGFGPAEVVAVYGCALFLVLALQSVSWRRAVAVAVVVVAAFVAVTRNASWFAPWALLASALLVSMLAVAVGIVSFLRARRVPFDETAEYGGASQATVTDTRERVIFWLGAAFAVAFAFSMGALETASTTFAAWSELNTLRFILQPVAVTLVAVALVIPLARQGAWAGRGVIAAAAFGWAMLAQLPPLFVVGIRLPVGEVILAGLVSALTWRDPEPYDESDSWHRMTTCQPWGSLAANATLATDIAAVLAVIPAGYFVYATHLSVQLTELGPQSAFAAGSVLQQLAGWVLTGLVYAMLRLRLPGKVGPLRALALVAAWFATAAAVQAGNGLTGSAGGWSWTFPGLELLLFLVAFSVIWDLCTLKVSTWKQAVDGLREAYRIQQARAIALYAVPVLLAVVTIGQQLASGTASDFVQSALNLPLDLLHF
jgi:hypothetical protein